MNPQRQLVSRPTRHRCTVLLRSWSGGLEFARGVVTEAAQYECSYRRTAHHATGIRYHSELRHIPLTLFAVARKPLFSCSTSELGQETYRVQHWWSKAWKCTSTRRSAALFGWPGCVCGRSTSVTICSPRSPSAWCRLLASAERNDYPQLFNRQNLHSLRSSASWRPTYLFQH